jgi:hypothetical protein
MILLPLEKFKIKLPLKKPSISLPLAWIPHPVKFWVRNQCGEYLAGVEIEYVTDGAAGALGETNESGWIEILPSDFGISYGVSTEYTSDPEIDDYSGGIITTVITVGTTDIIVPAVYAYGCEYEYDFGDNFSFETGGGGDTDILGIFVTITVDGNFFTNIGVLLRDRESAFGTGKLGFGQYTGWLPPDGGGIDPAKWILNAGLPPLPYDIPPPDDLDNFKSFAIALDSHWDKTPEYGEIKITYSNIRTWNDDLLDTRVDSYTWEEWHHEMEAVINSYTVDMPGEE